MQPALDDGDVRIWLGDAIDSLRAMPAGSAQTCITSPPFWGLRDYGCDGQIGLEETPDEWVARLVDVFREVRRVLRDDGTLWLEVGDSYASTGRGSFVPGDILAGRNLDGIASITRHGSVDKSKVAGLKPKDLVGAPWLLAFALRADGWYLRSDIIWARPNPMPESVSDRPTKAHSYVFLLTKRSRYYYDADAIREPHTQLAFVAQVERQRAREAAAAEERKAAHMDSPAEGVQRFGSTTADRHLNPAGRNARSVWNIATEPTPFAHFATFPQELVRRCILAGTGERGACPACGAPWARQVDATPSTNGRAGGDANWFKAQDANPSNRAGGFYDATRTTTGWAPTCTCDAGNPVPQTVCDPFMGSGTTALVARSLGRHAIGSELNADYLAIARKRLEQLSLLA